MFSTTSGYTRVNVQQLKNSASLFRRRDYASDKIVEAEGMNDIMRLYLRELRNFSIFYATMESTESKECRRLLDAIHYDGFLPLLLPSLLFLLHCFQIYFLHNSKKEICRSLLCILSTDSRVKFFGFNYLLHLTQLLEFQLTIFEWEMMQFYFSSSNFNWNRL